MRLSKLILIQGYTLKLEPQSGQNLKPQQVDGITQTIRLQGVEPGKGNNVKLRWRVSYSLAGQARNEQGELTSLGMV